jgi:hypothetical protein
MILQALHADKRLKKLGKQGRIIIKTPKSWKSGAASFSILYTDFLSIPRKE